MTTTPTGRGAWTTRGFPDGFAKMYRRHMSAPATGGQSALGQDYRAVHYGVLAIQVLLAMDNSTGPGIFGPATDAAVKAYQLVHVPPADGIVGPNTMKSLLNAPTALVSSQYQIPDRLVWGLTRQESVNDPGAIGYSTPSDTGLVQINLKAHPEISEYQAFLPSFALRWAAGRLRSAHDRYLAGGAADRLAWDCAVANHNAPSWADTWARTGSPPNAQIAQYVANVRLYALT